MLRHLAKPRLGFEYLKMQLYDTSHVLYSQNLQSKTVVQLELTKSVKIECMVLFIITGVARPSWPWIRNSEDPQTNGIILVGAPWTLSASWTLGAPGHCPPCPPCQPACYAPVYYVNVPRISARHLLIFHSSNDNE